MSWWVGRFVWRVFGETLRGQVLYGLVAEAVHVFNPYDGQPSGCHMLSWVCTMGVYMEKKDRVPDFENLRVVSKEGPMLKGVQPGRMVRV